MNTSNAEKKANTNLPTLHAGSLQNYLQLETDQAPLAYAHSTHRALTKFLAMMFANSVIELDEADTLALASISNLMVCFTVQPFTLQTPKGDTREQNHFCLATGSATPKKFALDSHKSLSKILCQVLQNTQLELDHEDADILSRVVDLMMRLQNAWENLR